MGNHALLLYSIFRGAFGRKLLFLFVFILFKGKEIKERKLILFLLLVTLCYLEQKKK